MDFYNEFLERLRNGEDANAIANEITKALNDSIKAKADEDEKAEKAKLDEEIAARKRKVEIAEQDMEAYLDVMYDYVNDYLDAYADAHEQKVAETMSKEELKSLLDTWAQTHVWINKVSKMDLSDMLDELSSLWTDIGLGKGLKDWNTKVTGKTKVNTDDLNKVYKVDLNDVEKSSVKSHPTDGIYAKECAKGCDCDKNCDKSVKKPIRAMEVNIAKENVNSHPTDENYARVMSADEIINEFLKALDKVR